MKKKNSHRLPNGLRRSEIISIRLTPQDIAVWDQIPTWLRGTLFAEFLKSLDLQKIKQEAKKYEV